MTMEQTHIIHWHNNNAGEALTPGNGETDDCRNVCVTESRLSDIVGRTDPSWRPPFM